MRLIPRSATVFSVPRKAPHSLQAAFCQAGKGAREDVMESRRRVLVAGMTRRRNDVLCRFGEHLHAKETTTPVNRDYSKGRAPGHLNCRASGPRPPLPTAAEF